MLPARTFRHDGHVLSRRRVDPYGCHPPRGASVTVVAFGRNASQVAGGGIPQSAALGRLRSRWPRQRARTARRKDRGPAAWGRVPRVTEGGPAAAGGVVASGPGCTVETGSRLEARGAARGHRGASRETGGAGSASREAPGSGSPAFDARRRGAQDTGTLSHAQG